MIRTKLFYEDDKNIFVHALYDPNLPMEEQTSEKLMWGRLTKGAPEPHFSGKTTYTGHSAQKNGEILDLGHFVCIDTYLYGGGWLTALETSSKECLQIDAGGRFRLSE